MVKHIIRYSLNFTDFPEYNVHGVHCFPINAYELAYGLQTKSCFFQFGIIACSLHVWWTLRVVFS